jgi:hypothetical protein
MRIDNTVLSLEHICYVRQAPAQLDVYSDSIPTPLICPSNSRDGQTLLQTVELLGFVRAGSYWINPRKVSLISGAPTTTIFFTGVVRPILVDRRLLEKLERYLSWEEYMANLQPDVADVADAGPATSPLVEALIADSPETYLPEEHPEDVKPDLASGAILSGDLAPAGASEADLAPKKRRVRK